LKNEVEPPQKPDMNQTIQQAMQLISGMGIPQNKGGVLDDAVRQMGIEPEQALQAIKQMMQGQPPQ
jgi:hypothetical protein